MAAPTPTSKEESEAAAAPMEDVVLTKDNESSSETPAAAVVPPLSAAALRLEALLGKNQSSSWTNPVRIVRRWLGTASGAAQAATLDDISDAATSLLPATQPGKELLMMDGSSTVDATSTETAAKVLSANSSWEVTAWLVSLKIRVLFKSDQLPAAFELSQQAIQLVDSHLLQEVKAGLFPLLARLRRYQSLCSGSNKSSLRSSLLEAHSTAVLRRDVDGQATLLNLLLSDMLDASEVEQANKLLSNSEFPDAASNNQLCRYLFYKGKIQALRLDYTSAFASLSQCSRKAPTNTAHGFRIKTQQLLVLTQLLMGDIPPRQELLAKELQPYLEVTQAVRRGDLQLFEKVIQTHRAQLLQDETFTLISRLSHVVVKAGLRQLSLSYSKITLKDIGQRLGLKEQNAEFIVAKAIRDGVLDATMDHSLGLVVTEETPNLYATGEPSSQLARRIAYCLTTHNDAMRGMRYPTKGYRFGSTAEDEELGDGVDVVVEDDDDEDDEY